MLNLDEFDSLIARCAPSIQMALVRESVKNQDDVRYEPGVFVFTPDSRLVGKLFSVDNQQAVVRFFHSITNIEEFRYAKSEVVPAALPRQTRVYARGKSPEDWKMGRVISYLGNRRYEIRFPNRLERVVNQSELEVRCLRPVVDPSEVLAAGGIESQFLHDRRINVVKSLLNLRGKSRGLTGLLSSSAEILPHQVDVIRRILEDPVQRYLLADEVGLGKTIEAGAVLRQVLLDVPEGKVFVVCPPALVSQWEYELTDKFHSNDFPGRLEILTVEEICARNSEPAELLIVDEAHHLVGLNHLDLDRLVEQSHQAKRLLLLSATPVIGNEKNFFTLLHMLDPVAHPAGDLESFGDKVTLRREYGQILLSLKPGLPPALLTSRLNRVEQAFPHDRYLQGLVNDARQNVQSDSLGLVKRHVAETYRLHQRLLRNRRKDLDRSIMKCRSGTLVFDDDADLRTESLWPLVEDWRVESRSALELHAECLGVTVSALELRQAKRYAGWIDSLGCGISEFIRILEQELKDPLVPPFHNEPALIQNMLNASQNAEMIIEDWLDPIPTLRGYSQPAPSGAIPRLLVVAHVLDAARRAGKHRRNWRCVCFSSSTQVARELFAFLSEVNVKGSIFGLFEDMSRAEIAKQIRAFRDSPEDSVLIADKAGEEGLNLQFAHAIIHLDLPFAASRIEQRIGRVDRFGRATEGIDQRVILPSEVAGGPWQAWFEILRDQTGIFNESISEVQFVLDSLHRNVELALYHNIGFGLRALGASISDLLAEERVRLDEQYALDALAEDEDSARDVYSALSEADEGPAFCSSLRDWLGQCVKLDERKARGGETFSLKWSQEVLIPELPWRTLLQESIQDGRRHFTYSRKVAQDFPAASLMRPGLAFVDNLEHLILRDDRGCAFATWRQLPNRVGEWMGFRLFYAIEADIDVASIPNSQHLRLSSSLRRRAGGYLPSWTEVLYVDATLQPVEDPSVISILELPYCDSRQSDGRQDYNLGSRRSALDSLITPSQFSDLCRSVRQLSEQLLRQNERFQSVVNDAVVRARTELLSINQRIQYRSAALLAESNGAKSPKADDEIAMNLAIIDATASPRVRLDAIGFFVIASYGPGEELVD